MVLRAGLPLTGGAELQDGGGIAQAGGLKGAEMRHSPREAVGDRWGAVRLEAVLFFQFWPFFFDLLAMVYMGWSAFYHFHPVQVENGKQIQLLEPRSER